MVQKVSSRRRSVSKQKIFTDLAQLLTDIYLISSPFKAQLLKHLYDRVTRLLFYHNHIIIINCNWLLQLLRVGL
jgi:hypothetical protein